MTTYRDKFTKSLIRIKYWDIMRKTDEIWELQDISSRMRARIHWPSQTVFITAMANDPPINKNNLSDDEVIINSIKITEEYVNAMQQWKMRRDKNR